jgi:sterol desaturase/sphingolipid hydroxylase (fatty acid hydroxylase superfamily)
VRVYRFPDAFSDLGCGVLQQVTTLFWSASFLAGYAWVYEHARLITLPTAWLPWVLAVVGYDLTYYCWHRLSHEVNVLWAAHGVHHQSEDYNLAVALRQSVTTSITGWPLYALLALAGVPPLQFAVAASLSLLYQFWIHTELVPKLGWFEALFNTPSLHRVHHAINDRYLDRNHAGTFIIWDKLFGTWEPETEPCVYGSRRPLQSVNPLWAQLEGFAHLWTMSRAAPSLGQALKVWVAAPSWKPTWWNPPQLPVPTTPQEQQKWAPPAGPAAQRYVLAQFSVLLVGTFCLLMWGGALGLAKTAAIVLVIYLSLIALSGVLEQRPWAPRLEALRLVGAAGLAAWLLLAPSAPAPSAPVAQAALAAPAEAALTP